MGEPQRRQFLGAFRALCATALCLACLGTATAQPPLPAEVSHADLRVYGKVAAAFSPDRVVFRCADTRHADILMGKLLADLFWDAGPEHQVTTAAVGDAQVAIHAWPPYGAITVARVGSDVVALGAESPRALLAAVKREPRLLAAEARYAPEADYPRCLDFYDLRAFKAYDHAMRSVSDLGLENHWPFAKRYGLGGLAFQSLSAGKSTAAPGVADWAPTDYEVREAEKQGGMAVLGLACSADFFVPAGRAGRRTPEVDLDGCTRQPGAPDIGAYAG